MKCEDLERVVIGDDPERFFQVGAQLPLLEKKQLVEFLRKNVHVFAWNAYEAPRVDPNFICHHLNVNPFITLKKQLPQRPSREHTEAIRNEVVKLKQAGAIKEVFYPQWLVNTVVVKKKTGKWRVCVDFTDLNTFPYASNRLVGRCNGRPSLDEFLGCLSRISSDTIGIG